MELSVRARLRRRAREQGGGRHAVHARRQGRPHSGDALSGALRAAADAVGTRGSVLRHAQWRTRARGYRRHRLRCALRARAHPRTESAGHAGAAGMSTLVMRRPDDWHLHLRDGAALHAVLPFTAARFARAMVMPNLTRPLTTTEAALAYRRRVLAGLARRLKVGPVTLLS